MAEKWWLASVMIVPYFGLRLENVGYFDTTLKDKAASQIRNKNLATDIRSLTSHCAQEKCVHLYQPNYH